MQEPAGGEPLLAAYLLFFTEAVTIDTSAEDSRGKVGSQKV